jgi:uncharacterized protein YndB with AHSA1/START domain
MPQIADYNAVATVTITASPQAVWEALTQPAWVQQYMHGTELKTDWRVGSPITWSGVWEGKPYQDKGTIQQYDAPKTLQYTHWSPVSGTPDLPKNYHVVSFNLTGNDDGGGTTLTLTQSNNASQEAADTMAQKAWLPMLQKLRELLEASRPGTAQAKP